MLVPKRSVTNTVYDNGTITTQIQKRPIIRTGTSAPSGIATAAVGDIYYDTSNNAVYWFNGTWINFNRYASEIKIGTTKPASPTNGMIFMDLSFNTAYWYNNGSWNTFSGVVADTSTAWQPSNVLSTLQLWLDANDTSNIKTNGNYVYSWSDKSGKGNHINNIITIPYYTLGVQNSKNAILLANSTNSGLSGPLSPITGGTLTMFTVAGLDTNNCGATARLLSIGTSTGTEVDSSGACIGRNNKPYISAARANTFIDASAGAIYFKPCIIVYDISGTSTLIYLNGTLKQTATVTPSSFTTALTKYAIGDVLQMTNLSANKWGGYLCELGIISGGMLTSGGISDRVRLEGYLAWKWGIQTDLPANHQYYNAPP